MLKALELHGFKSFADRTRFEFAPGITAIVGPNGSGKSNVVDAIKWVLGEQSVKSLRGQEMADVIFNGSSTRRPMNAAEITLILDNSRGILPIDCAEVSITRRFYRDGEGEYLINHQPCRLRDIRDLLGGTGLGTSAYCVIEQGKVDNLLQASLRDRRVIFEEAAGISRFKAKRAEALRRLERVEQNLLRLRDIVEEVESRLRTLRVQAGRARRYRELENQLQSLRTQLALSEWQESSEKLEVYKTERENLRHQLDSVAAEVEDCEQELSRLEELARESEKHLRETESQHASAKTQLEGLWERLELERQRSAGLAQAWAESHQNWVKTFRSGLAELEICRQLQVAIAENEDAQAGAKAELSAFESRLAELGLLLEQQQKQLDSARQQHFLASQKLAELQRQEAVLQTRLESTRQRLGEYAETQSRLREQEAALFQEETALSQQLAELSQRVQEAERALAEKRQALTSKEAEAAQKREELSAAEQQLAALRERMKVLEELLARFEGVSPGVQWLLRQKQANPSGPLRHVLGLLADGLSALPGVSRLVEIALFGRSHFLVAYPAEELLSYLSEIRDQLEGPAEILWAEQSPEWPPVRILSLEGHPGVIGRADTLVEPVPEFLPLVRRLLSNIWVVDRLDRALLLQQSLGTGVSFVTLAGEWLGGDGTLVVGPPRWVPGVLSRRSELRTLEEQTEQLQIRLALLTQDLNGLSADVRQLAEEMESFRNQRMELLQQSVAVEQALHELQERKQAIAAQIRQLNQEQAEILTQQTAVEQELASVTQRIHKCHTEVDQLAAALEQLRVAVAESNSQHLQTEQQVQRLKERLNSLKEERVRLAGELDRHQRVVYESNQHLAEIARENEKLRQLLCRHNLDVLHLGQELAACVARKEALGHTLRGHWEKLAQIDLQRRAARERLHHLREQQKNLEDQRHQLELAISQLQSQLEALATRYREDYGIQLTQVVDAAEGRLEIDRFEIQQQIDDVRRKLRSLGNVNLEALSELEQVEARYRELAEQYQDLVRAKETFHRILDRINTASREVFLRTVEEVRGHFADLFRTLFGGGHADILLEEGVDPLEAGVEIVARPPGKETRSITLLSGGEKTLASVALLLAIFRSRPSPFCVLDEVDAALDEANIDRFIKLLQEFPGCSQFILITHSKKTMTCAQTIYGVTMQEAGVSRQVSVRFEDISSTDFESAEFGRQLDSRKTSPQQAEDKIHIEAA